MTDRDYSRKALAKLLNVPEWHLCHHCFSQNRRWVQTKTQLEFRAQCSDCGMPSPYLRCFVDLSNSLTGSETGQTAQFGVSTFALPNEN